jgi:hypothetical protein
MARRVLFLLILAGCSRTSPQAGTTPTASASVSPSPSAVIASAAPPATPAPAGATSCGTEPTCFRFATAEEAFRHVLAKEPAVLAIGEAHAQKGTEAIASSTKRFTESLLPIVAPKASDVIVELWQPNPKCMKEVKQVASAQKPVVEAQAATNVNEYDTLAFTAKDVGVTPWLLRPTCDDFAAIADAGADAVGVMLSTVKRLTQAKVGQLYDRNVQDGKSPKTVIAYGGAMHNDLQPSEATKEWSFGPELDRMTNGKYVELDLIVPEYVKKSPNWEKLPWYAAFAAEEAKKAPRDKATLYVLGERSFVLVFPSSKK